MHTADQPAPTPRTADEKIDAALAMVSDLCNQRRTWTMSIPARPDYDPDLVIADALSTAKHALSEAKAEAERAQSLFAASVRDAERHYAEAERLREALLYAAETFRQINEGKHDPFSFDLRSNMRSAAGLALEKTRAALAATRKEDSGG